MRQDRQYRRTPRVVIGMVLGLLLGFVSSFGGGSNFREGLWTQEIRTIVGAVLGFVAGWVWTDEVNRR